LLDPYEDPTFTVHGIYVTLADANNTVRGIANGFDCIDTITSGVDSDGFVFWSCDDIGEGAPAKVSIEKMEVKPPGWEPEQVLVNVSRPGSKEEEVDGCGHVEEDSDREEEEDGESLRGPAVKGNYWYVERHRSIKDSNEHSSIYSMP
jgi:hypothetical protein